MVKKIFTWVILVALVTYVVLISLWAFGESRKNTCNGIIVNIDDVSTTDSVTKIGVISELKGFKGKITGQPLTMIDTRQIERYLESQPRFESVECNITSDGMLNISVVPMVPEIRVFEDTISYYINKEGKKMPSKASYFVDVPVVSGHFTNDFKPSDLLPVTRFIASDPMLSTLVGMVKGDGPDNIILIPRIQGHVINFGDTNRLQEKRDALKTVYKKVLPYKGWQEYDTISLKFKGQVVATRRNKLSKVPASPDYDEIDMEEATLPQLEFTENTN